MKKTAAKTSKGEKVAMMLGRPPGVPKKPKKKETAKKGKSAKPPYKTLKKDKPKTKRA